MDQDEDRGGDSEQDREAAEELPADDGDTSSPDAAFEPPFGFRLPAGFSQSLMPGMDDAAEKILSPLRAQLEAMLPDTSEYARAITGPLNRLLQDQMKAALPDYDSMFKKAIEPYNGRLREQTASIAASLPKFTGPMIDFPARKGIGVSPATESMLKQITAYQSEMFEGLRSSLKPLFDPELLCGFNRALLPPNLRVYADEIQAHQVHGFLEQEGIPLYLVPRGRTALRLLRAKNRAGRRRVLGDCYESLMENCAAVLERAEHEAISDERAFALDGLGAMRAGHARSAQAMFNVTLDTLICRFYPDRKARGVITNRKRDAGVPETLDEMSVREAFVWLPIWNAHEEFWKHKGDKVPHYYSRQFSKRNCIQVLMLVTSLIGYADRVARESG